jgi:ABC-2 type transport system permease protein
MNVYLTTLKREFQEHRAVFVLLPLILAAVLIVIMVYVAIKLPDNNILFEFHSIESSSIEDSNTDGSSVNQAEYRIDFSRGELVVIDDAAADTSHAFAINDAVISSMYGIQFLFLSFSGMVVIYYLLVCLYADRKDRSILFWKSMPVSESLNIAIKFLVAVIAIPLVATVISWLVQLGFLILAWILTGKMAADTAPIIWSNIDILSTFARQIYVMLSFSIWILPVNAWLMLSSALARRSPFLIATIPVAVIILFERLVFDSSLIARWIGEHFAMGIIKASSVLPYEIDTGQANIALGTADLLLGFVITGLLLGAAVWLRNYRFEM